MIHMAPYLYFTGTCESALAFYTQCGLGESREMRRYAGTPLVSRHGEAWRDKVLHSVFEGPGVRFFASDGPDSEPMKGCALLVELANVDEAASIFERLSQGGRITLPFVRQVWGDHYGNFTDRFGVQWAVSCAAGGARAGAAD